MQAPIQGTIFDLGSTLVRYTGSWDEIVGPSIQALAQALRAAGLDLEFEAFQRAFRDELIDRHQARAAQVTETTTLEILRGVLDAIAPDHLDDAALTEALRSFYALSETRWEPMPGVFELLTALQSEGMRLGIISNAGDEPNVQRMIDNASLRAYFDPILVSAAEGIRKPHPRLFEKVLQQWGLAADRVIMVGDTLGADVLGARNAGCHSIWLTAQAESPENDRDAGRIHPDFTAATLMEVLDIIRDLNGTPG
jgi:HAD superfamily hydrolase (TIGR01662 family)